ncbi:MAG: hypothetical protein A2655_00545 [Candidatus Yanofskybacteria bacterium RIFCSPHIGHO2_01_FULL_43_42]|uniref:Guanylate kinase-like domain-containing protein n=1 Tax=Candidatus Yanofskybacteria bacterium RIFCSPLOWO2_01_FULL_43_22 TaxID=1802695 RepID=A0A1F8GG35_9BACT|nr:MAG: hypothetical protein A2655_00545 [Candidatus Yanofskybacteria bacterium RIFCSPHIGHO2_01_FULL_43_42]OGN13744.1 MAG: hypothetical protein A3D48_00295 [Candidatus Yanofskybacteria bacterium RIFCSPHIGHO2_02_FULL_43_17]OGN24263.1 MAG: hypothetical protein A3A13_03745 [Candidatus Yanofskybacteria bacterium RIFCSPLOWO2_01_FULL_43_22]
MPDMKMFGLVLIGLACFVFWLYWTLKIRFFGRQRIRILTVTGPSGSGKTTIVGELLKKHPEWKMVLSLTSRESRESDLPGEYRCNVSRKEFLRRELGREFMWLVRAHGNMYGTLQADVRMALDSRNLSLMQILPDSVKQLRIQAPGRVLSVFILPPDEEGLRRRLERRGEQPEAIERRVADCRKWEEEARFSDIPYEFIRNDGTVVEAVEKVEQIIKKHL